MNAKQTSNRILSIIKRIAYQPTRSERIVFADTILQQITQMIAWDKQLMGVAARKDGQPGVLMVYNPEGVDQLTDAQLATLLAHETQHLRFRDGQEGAKYAAMEWPNGWKGPMLHNVARDCQINDELYRLGFAVIPDGMSGEKDLGRNTEKDEITSLMREVAEKFPPPQDGAQGSDPNQGDASEDLAQAAAQAVENGEGDKEEVQVGRAAGKEPTIKPARVKGTLEQARWDNFLATILCTKQSEDRWHQQPKRMSGVDLYSGYEAMLPRRQPLPRKTALMAIDVSGSMDTRGVQRICNLVRSAPANYNLTVVCFDTGLDVWENFRTNDEMPRSGGGTDFKVVEAFARSMSSGYPDAIICITDGGGEVPEVKKPKNWTWIAYQTDFNEMQKTFGMKVVDLDAIIKR